MYRGEICGRMALRYVFRSSRRRLLRSFFNSSNNNNNINMSRFSNKWRYETIEMMRYNRFRSSIATMMPETRNDELKLTARSIAHLPLFGWKVLAATGAITAAKKVAIVGIVNKYGVKETFELLTNASSKVRDLGLMNESQHETLCSGLKHLEITVRGLQENQAAQKIYEYLENLEKRNPDIATSVLKVFIENFKSFKVFRTVMNPKHSIVEAKSSSEESSPEIESQEEYDSLLRNMQEKFPELKKYHVVLVRKEDQN